MRFVIFRSEPVVTALIGGGAIRAFGPFKTGFEPLPAGATEREGHSEAARNRLDDFALNPANILNIRQNLRFRRYVDIGQKGHPVNRKIGHLARMLGHVGQHEPSKNDPAGRVRLIRRLVLGP